MKKQDLQVRLKAALLEHKIRLRSKNAADRGLAKVERIIAKLKEKLNDS